MSRFGIIGHPVSASLSPRLLGSLGLEYSAIDVEPGGLDRFFLHEAKSLSGFNITHPHKAGVIPFLHELSADAAAVRAVNCVVRVKDKWVGHNTDHLGVSHVLNKQGLRPKKALILGTGGAARASAHALVSQGARVVMVSRKPGPGQLSWRDLQDMTGTNARTWDILVNATPLEMPEVNLELFDRSCFVFDMNYKTTGTTPLVQRARDIGMTGCDGLDMLLAQHSWNLVIWLGGEQEDWLEKLENALLEVVS